MDTKTANDMNGKPILIQSCYVQDWNNTFTITQTGDYAFDVQHVVRSDIHKDDRLTQWLIPFSYNYPDYVQMIQVLDSKGNSIPFKLHSPLRCLGNHEWKTGPTDVIPLIKAILNDKFFKEVMNDGHSYLSKMDITSRGVRAQPINVIMIEVKGKEAHYLEWIGVSEWTLVEVVDGVHWICPNYHRSSWRVPCNHRCTGSC
jgi:hypothetical protein